MQPAAHSSCRTKRKGKNPGEEDEMDHLNGNVVIFLFPIAIIVVVFTFTGVVHWVDSQRKEREAF